MRVKRIIEFPIYNETCVSIRARMVRWFHPDWAANSASWWSAAWRAWPAPEAPRAPVLSKIRATVTQRKRKKVKAKHVLLPFNPRTPLSSPLVPPAVPLLLPLLLSPLLHPFCPGMKAPFRFVFQSESDGTFPPPVRQYNQCSRSDCHPTESGEASVYFLSWPQLLHSSLPWAQHVSHVVSNVLFWVWLAVYSGGSGRAPCEFLLQHAASITTRFTWHLKNRRACNIFFLSLVYKECFKDRVWRRRHVRVRMDS